MIAARKYVPVRIEIELRVLAPELRILEQDWENMTLLRFLEVWGPEREGARVVAYLKRTRSEEKEDKKEVAPAEEAIDSIGEVKT